MLKRIEVVYDGSVFVPTLPLDLPSGTKLTLTVPESSSSFRLGSQSPTQPLRNMTAEEKNHWERLCRHWETTSSPFASVEEAMAYSRGRPWPELLLSPDPANETASSPREKDDKSC